jgi:hypothetical protein
MECQAMGAEAMPIARPRASRGLAVTSQGVASDVVPDMIGSYHSISAAASGRLRGGRKRRALALHIIGSLQPSTSIG